MNYKLIPMLCLLATACGDNDRGDGLVRVTLPETGSSAASRAPSTALTMSTSLPLVWTQSQSARAAWYGPPNAPALLAISCEGWEKRAARMVIVRYAAAESGAKALFAIQGSKGILRLPVSAVKISTRGYVWRGVLDAADPRAEVLLGTRLKATVPGGGELGLPPMGEAGVVVSECVLAAARSAVVQSLPNLDSNPETSPVDK